MSSQGRGEWAARPRLSPSICPSLDTTKSPGSNPPPGYANPGGREWGREGREGGRAATRAISDGGAHRLGPKQTITTCKKPKARRPSPTTRIKSGSDGRQNPPGAAEAPAGRSGERGRGNEKAEETPKAKRHGSSKPRQRKKGRRPGEGAWKSLSEAGIGPQRR